MTIDDAVTELNVGDLVRVRWKPIIKLYGRDTFLGRYVSHDANKRTLTVNRDAFDMLDFKIEVNRTMSYDRIESLERLEQKKLY